MNARLSLILLAIAAAHAQAADPAHPALDAVVIRAQAPLVVDCRAERLPSLRAVGEVLETNNGSRIYAERDRLVHIAHRECARGAASVAFVRDASSPEQSLALAGTPSRP